MEENLYSIRSNDEQEQKSSEWIKAVRKKFSRIGIAFLGGSLLIYVVQILGTFLLGVILEGHQLNESWNLLFSMLPTYLIGMPGLIFLLTRVKIWKGIPQHKMSVGQVLIAFLMAYSILYLSNLVGVLVTTIVGILKGSPVQNVLSDMSINTNTAILFIVTVIGAPIYEEFIFRKILIDRIIPYGEGVAILISGFLFGLFHGNFSQFIYAFTLGIFLAFIYIRTGKVRYTIVLHAMVNFMGTIAAVLLMKIIDMDNLQLELEQMIRLSETKGLTMGVIPTSLWILFAYVVFVLCIVLAGIICLCVYRKRFQLQPTEAQIPKGKRFMIVYANVGMISLTIFWVVRIVAQLFE